MENSSEGTHSNMNSCSISSEGSTGLSVCPPTHNEDVQAKRNTHGLLCSNPTLQKCGKTYLEKTSDY